MVTDDHNQNMMERQVTLGISTISLQRDPMYGYATRAEESPQKDETRTPNLRTIGFHRVEPRIDPARISDELQPAMGDNDEELAIKHQQ